jgi:hypothetical protein
MPSDIGRLKKKIKFYFENNTKVKLQSRELILEGQIISLPSIMKPSFDFKLNDGNLMQVYLDDIYPDSIYPSSSSVKVIEENKSKLRKSIPKSLKMDLWRNHFGHQFKGRCFCCKKEIMRDNFEAGHHLSDSNGGSDSLDNLRPICFDCNRSMGSINMNEFISEYYN